jgi:hypothetical protein
MKSFLTYVLCIILVLAIIDITVEVMILLINVFLCLVIIYNMTTQFSPQEYAEETKQENIGFLRTGKNRYFFLHLGHIKFRSWVWFPMGSLDFSVDLILPAALWPRVNWASIFLGGKGWVACQADNLTAICELTVIENLGALTSHNPMGFHGLLQG